MLPPLEILRIQGVTQPGFVCIFFRYDVRQLMCLVPSSCLPQGMMHIRGVTRRGFGCIFSPVGRKL